MSRDFCCFQVLSGMARLSDRHISLQRIEELIDAASWLVFASSARILYHHAQINFGVDAPTGPRTSAAMK